MSYLINTLLHPLSIFLGVLLVFIGIISYYFNNKIKEQNLKIESIASVVSTMALEMRNIHGSGILNTPQNSNDKYINLNTTNLNNEIENNHSLINVSDNEENNCSEDESQESYESESDGYQTDSSDESNESTNEDNNESDDDDDNKENKKILQQEYSHVNIAENIIVLKIDSPFLNNEELHNIEDDSHNRDVLDIENITQNKDNIKFELKEEPLIENVELINVIMEDVGESHKVYQDNTLVDLNNIEFLTKPFEVDYKKMTLVKLKEIALEKGLIDENSKLKKQELLKLLIN